MSKKDPLMKIKDISKLIKYLAIHGAKECGIDSKKDKIKNYINTSNIKQIIAEHAKQDKNGNLMINNKIFAKIQDDIMEWILGVSLAKSAAKNEIECSWDDSRNCMIFKIN
jgi:hypothetical protein